MGTFFGFELGLDAYSRSFLGFELQIGYNLVVTVNSTLLGTPIEEDFEITLTPDGESPQTISNTGTGTVKVLLNDPGNFNVAFVNNSSWTGDPAGIDFTYDGVATVLVTINVTEPPCVSKSTTNIYSFFQWFRVSGFTLSEINRANLLLSCDNDLGDSLPNIFNEDDCTEWQPIALQEEQITVQINKRLALPAGPLRVAIVHDFTVIQQDIPVTTIVNAQGTIAYFSHTFPDSETVAGEDYRFLLYDSTTTAVFYISNYFEIGYAGHREEILKQSIALKYRHHTNLDGFEYTDLPSYYNEIRVRANLIDHGFDYDRSNYKEVTTGINTREKSQKSKFVKLEPYLFNEYAHEALASLTDHEEVYINGMKVNSKQGSTTRFQRDLKTSMGETEWYIEKFSTVNY